MIFNYLKLVVCGVMIGDCVISFVNERTFSNRMWLVLAVLWVYIFIKEALDIRRVRRDKMKAKFYDSIYKAQTHDKDKSPN